MKINAIVAIDKDGLIGYDNQLIWHIPEDLKFFQKMTKNKFIIMGRKTFMSLPNGPLPNRINLVITKDYESFHNHPYKNTFFVPSIEDALFKANELANMNFFDFSVDDKEVFVIGGANTYNQFIEKDLIDNFYVTKILKSYSLDNHFDKEKCTFFDTENLSPFTEEKIDSILNYPFDIEVYKYSK